MAGRLLGIALLCLAVALAFAIGVGILGNHPSPCQPSPAITATANGDFPALHLPGSGAASTNWPSLTGMLLPGWCDMRTTPSLPSRR